MGKSQRTKGHAWERRIARWLTEVTGLEHRRVLVETREGNSSDVVTDDTGVLLPVAIMHRDGGEQVVAMRPWVFRELLSYSSLKGHFGFAVQAKIGKKPPSVWKAVEEAEEPLLPHKEDRI